MRFSVRLGNTLISRNTTRSAVGLPINSLWNNTDPFDPGDAESDSVLLDLLRKDKQATKTGRIPCLFAFFVCKPQ